MILSDPFVISDTHIFHDKIMEYVPGRKKYYGDPVSMNEKIIKDWNSVVGVNDTVIHVGDMVFYKMDTIHRLNGRKILIIGNHDRNWKRLLRDNLISIAMEGMDITLFGKKIRFQHHPEEDWHGKNKGSILIHGHEHGDGSIMRYNAIDVGIDLPYMMHRPQRLSKVLGILEKRNAVIKAR